MTFNIIIFKIIFKDFYIIANKDISERVSVDEQHELRLWKTGEETFSDVINFIKEDLILDNNNLAAPIDYEGVI